MKQLNRILLLSLLALAFAACSDDDDAKTPVEYDVISFEPAEVMLDATGLPVTLRDVEIVGAFAGGSFKQVFCAKEYMNKENTSGNYFDDILFTTSDGKIVFGSYFSDNAKSSYGASDTWGGFALTRNYDKTATADNLKNQFSAWASTGANGTETCMVGYDSSYDGVLYALPMIEFTTPRTVDHLYMANSTMTYPYKPSAAVPAGETYYYKVVVTGSLNGVEKGKVECLLVYGDKKTADWTKFSLAMLGEVDKLVFKPASNDANSWGVSAPTYFCIDEIALVKK